MAMGIPEHHDRLNSTKSLQPSILESSSSAKSIELTAPKTPTELPPRPNLSEAPGWRFHAAFGCLCLVNFVCALDATSLAVAIPVRSYSFPLYEHRLTRTRSLLRNSMAQLSKPVGGAQASYLPLLFSNQHLPLFQTSLGEKRYFLSL